MARVTAQRPSARIQTTPAVVLTLLRRLRVELPLAGSVMGVVLVTALVFAMFPRLFNQMSDDGLRYAVRTSEVYEKNLVMSRALRLEPGAGGDVFANVDAEGAAFQGTFAPAIGELIDHRAFVFDAPRYRFPEPRPSGFSRYITMRAQSGIDEHVKLAEGRMPAPTTGVLIAADSQQPAMPVIEIAMSAETAEALGISLGATIPLEADPNDRMVTIPRGEVKDLAVSVVGFIDVLDVDDDYWFRDPRLDRASVFDDGNSVQIYASALFAPSAYGDLLRATDPGLFNYSWRYYTDPERFSAGQLDQLTSDLKRLNTEYASPFMTSPVNTTVSTQLSAILTRFGAERRLTEAIVSLSGTGLLAVALATIGLVCAFIAERRREMVALVRGRGASPRQLLGTQLVEGLLLGLPAGLLGYALASLLIDARPSTWSLYAALGIVVMTTLLLLGAAVPFARRPLGSLERADVAQRRFSARRLAFETFVVVLAAVGIYLLRRRGLAGDATTARVGGFDPYLAAVPILLGLATGLAALRLYVIPIRLLAWYAAFRSDLVPFLGFRRIARQSAVTSVPLLVLLLSVAVSVFSSVMLHTIESGQIRTSWERVGADYRIDAFQGMPLYREVDFSGVEGVVASASAYRQDGVAIVEGGPLVRGLTLLALEPEKYQAVTAGTPVDQHLSPFLLAQQTGADIGTPANPIPAIVSREWVSGRPINPGDTFTLEFQRTRMTFVVREARDRFVGMPASGSFVVASLPSIQAAPGGANVARNQLFLRAPATAVTELRQSLDAQSFLARLTSRTEEYNAVHDSPLISGAANGFRISIAIAAAYTALAVVVALALTGRARARDIAYLRTLGLSPRQVLGLTVAEQAPPVALALLIGTALGIGVAHLIEPGLDLTAFTGPDVPVALQVDWTAVAMLALGLVAVVALAVTAVSLLAERTNLAGVLRLGDR